MPHTNVKTRWIDGDLVYFDKAGLEIFRIDGTNRKMVFPAGSVLDLDAAAGILLPAAAEIVAADIADNILTGLKAANVADANLVGGLSVLHRFAIADQASGNLDWPLNHKTKIIDAWIIKGAAGHATEDTIKLQNVTTDITAALVMANVANARKSFVTFDEAQTTIAAGANLRAVLVRGSGGGNNTACTLYVHGLRVA